MRLTTVLVTGISVLLMLFTACQKTGTYYCDEGVEGTYEAPMTTTTKTSLEVTPGTTENEFVVLITTIDKTTGINKSAAITAYLEEEEKVLLIPEQDYGSIDIQISGQLQVEQEHLSGTLYTNIPSSKQVQIQHQKQ